MIFKEVTLTFRYEKIPNKDDDYYRNKVFDEIYNSDDNIDISNAIVKEAE